MQQLHWVDPLTTLAKEIMKFRRKENNVMQIKFFKCCELGSSEAFCCELEPEPELAAGSCIFVNRSLNWLLFLSTNCIELLVLKDFQSSLASVAWCQIPPTVEPIRWNSTKPEIQLGPSSLFVLCFDPNPPLLSLVSCMVLVLARTISRTWSRLVWPPGCHRICSRCSSGWLRDPALAILVSNPSFEVSCW